MRGACLGLALAAAVAAGPAASATWSIILVDTRTGEVAAGSCTCLTNFDLRANTPVLLAGVGAAAAQSAVDGDGVNRVFIRDRLLEGAAPVQILDGLAMFDPQHQSRQYGIVDVWGGAATFTGSAAGAWKGGRTGLTGTIAYAVQGNVLSGEPVVDRAVEAIRNTPGDLAAKLMASMEAARASGGDGRCSCAGQAPEACGPTPPAFAKASHIGYMLIARAGDRDGSNSIYRVARTPLALAAADFDGDGRMDLAAAGSNADAVTVLRGVPGSTPPRYEQTTEATAGDGPRDLAAADFNGDGLIDVLTANFAGDSVWLLRGDGAGGLDAGAATPCGDGPVAVLARDFNGDGSIDAAVVNNLAGTVTVLLNDGTGAFTSRSTPAGSSPNGIAAADEDGDGDLDLYIACTGSRAVRVLRNDAGVFAATPLIPVDTGVWTLQPADLDADGDLDLVLAATTEAMVRVMLKTPAGYAPAALHDVQAQPWHLVVRDVTADGVPDVLAACRSGRAVSILPGIGGGALGPAITVPVGLQGQHLVVADMDGDGDDDLALAQPANNSVNVLENFAGPGAAARFQDIPGCASGDYFMEFNVPFQTAADPDPVFTLRAMYDQWRAALAGVPDAVRSEVRFDGESLRATGPGVLAVVPRDWRDEPAAADAVTIEAIAGVPVRVAAITADPDGSWRASLVAGAACGEAQLRITVASGSRRAVLMPVFTIAVGPRADLTGDGVADFLDLLEFLDRYDAGDAAADVDGDGGLDAADFQWMLDGLAAQC